MLIDLLILHHLFLLPLKLQFFHLHVYFWQFYDACFLRREKPSEKRGGVDSWILMSEGRQPPGAL